MLPAAPRADPTVTRSPAVVHWAMGAGPDTAVVEGAGGGAGDREDAGGAEWIAAGVVDGTTVGARCCEGFELTGSRLAPGRLPACGWADGPLQAAVSKPAHRTAAAA